MNEFYFSDNIVTNCRGVGRCFNLGRSYTGADPGLWKGGGGGGAQGRVWPGASARSSQRLGGVWGHANKATQWRPLFEATTSRRQCGLLRYIYFYIYSISIIINIHF